MTDVLNGLKGGLIVSCQAPEGNPLRTAEVMAAMAKAVVERGAVGIRANGPDHVAAIRAAVSIPIIGLNKVVVPDSEVYITPTVETAIPLLEAGADIIAVDATLRPRPKGGEISEMIDAIHAKGGLVMADCSTWEEGLQAAESGADFVGTTLSGYTPYSRSTTGPDLELVSELAARVKVPVIAEGRYSTPEDAAEALRRGAWAVVVGTAITRPDEIAAQFLERLRSETP